MVQPAFEKPAIAWIPGLAEPYLREYTPRREARSVLHGFRFEAGHRLSARKRVAGEPAAGFFAGYLLSDRGWKFLPPFAPECLVFAYVLPVGSSTHKKLVAADDALIRQTFEYIRWLTHRPPRFQFFDKETPALIRHIPLSAWPARRIEHYSRNFFIETLAWLVRSALVRRLAQT